MTKHESSVNFENLIKDLADMYPFDVGTVVLIELVANALDSKATRITIDYRPQEKSLVVTDNGTGMTANGFDQYHDFAAGLKTRGMGIGFAGVGAKISFNIASAVITETRSESFTGGSNWYFEAKKKLVWEEIAPLNLQGNGTMVTVKFSKDVSLPFSSNEDIYSLLRQHYLPLFDKKFLDLYHHLGYYAEDLRFVVNGQQFEPTDIASDYSLQHVREFFPEKARKRIGYGLFGLSGTEYVAGGNLCGILLCTHGKVVKADMFNQFPYEVGPRILGVVEVPDFIYFLTSAKNDFVKRKRLKEFEALYDPIRQEFKNWLSELGVQKLETVADEDALKLEKEIRKIIDDIPELGDFFGFRTPKKILSPDINGSSTAEMQEGTQITFPVGEGGGTGGEGMPEPGDDPGKAPVEKEDGNTPVKPISRTGRRGPKIAFANTPNREDLAWVDGNSIVVNSGHPAYKKVDANFAAKRHHCLFAIAIAVQKFISSPDLTESTFTDRMMAAWGKK